MGEVVRKAAIIALGALLYAMPAVAVAADTVRVAVPDRGAWDTSYTELGLQQGFFQEQNLDVRIVHVADEAALETALSAGTADLAVAAGFPDILAAWVKGAPFKVISPEATGAPDIFWFAKVGTPFRSMKDLHGKAVGFGVPGALSHFVLLTLLDEAGVADAHLVATGPADNGIPLVLSAQLDASWGGPVAAAKDLLAGEVKLIARGNDSAQVRNTTVRVNVANAGFLAGHRGAVRRFLQAYRKSVDWAYSSPAAVAAYARLSDQSLEFAKYIVTEFASKAAAQLDDIKDEDRAVAEAVVSKRIPHAVSHDEMKSLYDFVLKDGP
jgi:NitT/TauT family transport system substrate-binding protein